MAWSGHCTITTTLRRFSAWVGEDFLTTYNEDDCDCDDDGDFFCFLLDVKFYANGFCPETQGHVSIMFNIRGSTVRHSRESETLCCVASVIDASGNKRFPQSFAFDFDVVSKDDIYFPGSFGFEKYIERSTLMNDSFELLPDDSLTLCLEIEYSFSSRNFRLHIEGDKYASVFERENGNVYLRSEFVQDLCKMSSVFRDMMECPIVESGPGRILIPQEEESSFCIIHDFNNKKILEARMVDICKLYIVADKYDMPNIIELCHQLLINVIRSINTQKRQEFVSKIIHATIELAERFEYDERLKEILKIYSDIKNKFEAGTPETDVSGKLGNEWECYFTEKWSPARLIWFGKIDEEKLEMNLLK